MPRSVQIQADTFPWRVANDVDDIMDLLGPSVKPARTPSSPPPDPDRYYNHLRNQEDRTHTAHTWLPTDVVNHYREYDRPTNNSDYQAVKRVIGEQGIRLPLWISANDTHGLLVEGNNRLQAAKELGIPSLPVRFTRDNPVMSNEGNPPVPHHPAVKQWLNSNRVGHRIAAIEYQREGDPDRFHTWHAFDGDNKVGQLDVAHEDIPFEDRYRGVRPRAYVSDLWVHPDYQRQGIASQLWEQAGRPLHTPNRQSPSGGAWARSVGGESLDD